MKKKEGVITFKVNEDLLEVIRAIPNRSEFIRAAILAALENVCPLCSGTGILSPKQKAHWEAFAEHHTVVRCAECDEFVMACDKDSEGRE